jgi:hypothetical protein
MESHGAPGFIKLSSGNVLLVAALCEEACKDADVSFVDSTGQFVQHHFDKRDRMSWLHSKGFHEHACGSVLGSDVRALKPSRKGTLLARRTRT